MAGRVKQMKPTYASAVADRRFYTHMMLLVFSSLILARYSLSKPSSFPSALLRHWDPPRLTSTLLLPSNHLYTQHVSPPPPTPSLHPHFLVDCRA
jgi:hypothetical protein